MFITSALVAASLTASPVTSGAIARQAEPDLQAAHLVAGRNADAIAELEAVRSHDPAQLINLGIAYARQGDEERARALFMAAAASNDRIEIDTANGSETDSRRLARKALRMLDNDEFAPARSERFANRVSLKE